MRLRRLLGVIDPHVTFEFEDAYWRSPEDDRRGVIERYLRTHPGGGPGVGGSLAAYRQRCRREGA
jgi:hypothetical protein